MWILMVPEQCTYQHGTEQDISGNPGKGFVVRAVPKNWKYEQQPVFSKLSVSKLADQLKAQNAVNRLAAQQELLSRPTAQTAAPVWKIATDKAAPLYSRVAALYTYLQITGATGTKNILKLVDDKDMKQYAIRALTDRKGKPCGSSNGSHFWRLLVMNRRE